MGEFGRPPLTACVRLPNAALDELLTISIATGRATGLRIASAGSQRRWSGRRRSAVPSASPLRCDWHRDHRHHGGCTSVVRWRSPCTCFNPTIPTFRRPETTRLRTAVEGAGAGAVARVPVRVCRPPLAYPATPRGANPTGSTKLSRGVATSDQPLLASG